MQTLNVSDRNLILKFNKEKRRPDIVKPTFKPELNKKSQLIVSQKIHGYGPNNTGAVASQFDGRNSLTFGKRNNSRGANQPMSFYERQ